LAWFRPGFDLTATPTHPKNNGKLQPIPAYSSLSQQNYPWGVGWSRLELDGLLCDSKKFPYQISAVV
jgi:hypothetical protein